MKLTGLGVNQLSTDGVGWYVRYLAAWEAKQADAHASFLANNIVVQLGNNVPIYTRRAIMPVVERIWSRYRSLDHEILNLYGSDRSFAAEVLWHFIRLDGAAITIPAMIAIERDETGLASSIRTYSNVTPIFETHNLANDV
jgi:hypothetical protein